MKYFIRDTLHGSTELSRSQIRYTSCAF